MISIIDRMLFREILTALGVILIVISVVLLANTLVRVFGQVAAGGLDQGVVFVFVGLKLLKALGLMIPPAFFFAVLLVLSRMYRESEMVALETAGVGPFRVFRAVALVAVPLAMLVTWLIMVVLPWSESYTEVLKQEQSKTSGITALRSGRFNELQNGELVIFADHVDEEARLRGVFVQHRQRGKVGLVVAETAELRRRLIAGEDYIVLTDGKRYEGWPGQENFAIGTFEQYGLRVSVERPGKQRDLHQSAKSWKALLASGELKDRAEFQYRLAFPLAIFALILVAMPLVRSRPRQGSFVRLAAGVLIYFVFMNLLRVAQEWMESGITPPWFGVWWVPTIFAAMAVIVLAVDSLRFRDLLRHRRERK